MIVDRADYHSMTWVLSGSVVQIFAFVWKVSHRSEQHNIYGLILTSNIHWRERSATDSIFMFCGAGIKQIESNWIKQSEIPDYVCLYVCICIFLFSCMASCTIDDLLSLNICECYKLWHLSVLNSFKEKNTTEANYDSWSQLMFGANTLRCILKLCLSIHLY